jgi:hypothetical protein
MRQQSPALLQLLLAPALIHLGHLQAQRLVAMAPPVQNLLLMALAAQVVPEQRHHQHQMGQLLLLARLVIRATTHCVLLAGHRNYFLQLNYYRPRHKRTGLIIPLMAAAVLARVM